MALGKPGDVVSYTSPLDSTTHYGVVVGVPDATHNVVARNLGVNQRDRIEWKHEESVTAVTVLSSTDALHG